MCAQQEQDTNARKHEAVALSAEKGFWTQIVIPITIHASNENLKQISIGARGEHVEMFSVRKMLQVLWIYPRQ